MKNFWIYIFLFLIITIISTVSVHANYQKCMSSDNICFDTPNDWRTILALGVTPCAADELGTCYDGCSDYIIGGTYQGLCKDEDNDLNNNVCISQGSTVTACSRIYYNLSQPYNRLQCEGYLDPTGYFVEGTGDVCATNQYCDDTAAHSYNTSYVGGCLNMSSTYEGEIGIRNFCSSSYHYCAEGYYTNDSYYGYTVTCTAGSQYCTYHCKNADGSNGYSYPPGLPGYCNDTLSSLPLLHMLNICYSNGGVSSLCSNATFNQTTSVLTCVGTSTACGNGCLEIGGTGNLSSDYSIDWQGYCESGTNCSNDCLFDGEGICASLNTYRTCAIDENGCFNIQSTIHTCHGNEICGAIGNSGLTEGCLNYTSTNLSTNFKPFRDQPDNINTWTLSTTKRNLSITPVSDILIDNGLINILHNVTMSGTNENKFYAYDCNYSETSFNYQDDLSEYGFTAKNDNRKIILNFSMTLDYDYNMSGNVIEFQYESSIPTIVFIRPNGGDIINIYDGPTETEDVEEFYQSPIYSYAYDNSLQYGQLIYDLETNTFQLIINNITLPTISAGGNFGGEEGGNPLLNDIFIASVNVAGGEWVLNTNLTVLNAYYTTAPDFRFYDWYDEGFGTNIFACTPTTLGCYDVKVYGMLQGANTFNSYNDTITLPDYSNSKDYLECVNTAGTEPIVTPGSGENSDCTKNLFPCGLSDSEMLLIVILVLIATIIIIFGLFAFLSHGNTGLMILGGVLSLIVDIGWLFYFDSIQYIKPYIIIIMAVIAGTILFFVVKSIIVGSSNNSGGV